MSDGGKMRIAGPCRLEGRVAAAAGKNAVLPQMAAGLLTDGEVVLKRVPALSDVAVMADILGGLGQSVSFCQGGAVMRPSGGSGIGVEYGQAKRMRASVLVMGPLLARRGAAELALPGGCQIGTRPIDLHIEGFRRMGARVWQEEGRIRAEAEGLQGAEIYLDVPSVGATENLMMAATLAKGVTTIDNAAMEPEVEDLARMLKAMGARIAGAGTGRISVEGVGTLHGAEHNTIADRIEAATYMIAAAATGGDVLVEGAPWRQLRAVCAKLGQCGAELVESPWGIRVRMRGRPKAIQVHTMQYPGFPTDAQAPIMALLCRAEGASVVRETIFENRFLHVSELRRLGADITVQDRTAVIEGREELCGASMTATDLRAGAALAIGALGAQGISQIHQPYHISRGYEDFVPKLRALGADIYMAE